MDKASVKKALEELKNSSKRNFKQTVDLIIVLKNIDLKKPENHVDFYQQMHHSIGKPIKLCALVDTELLPQAKGLFDTTIHVDDFPKYIKDKRLVKKLAKEHAFFVAQATLMQKIAAAFGRVLGPRGKMPNPKAGCVVSPNANLKPLVEKLKSTIRVMAKTSPMIQIAVGREDSKEDDIADNVASIYDAVLHHLAGGKNNISKVMIKLTMSKPIKLDI